MGTEKQKQQLTDCFGFGLVIIGGRPWCSLPALGLAGLGRFRFSDCVCATSSRPSLSASVSRLVLSSRIGVLDILGPGLDRADMAACSLCCQQ